MVDVHGIYVVHDAAAVHDESIDPLSCDPSVAQLYHASHGHHYHYVRAKEVLCCRSDQIREESYGNGSFIYVMGCSQQD